MSVFLTQKNIFTTVILPSPSEFMVIPHKSLNPVLSRVQGILPHQNGAVWKRITQVSDLGHSGTGKGECVTHNATHQLLTQNIKRFCARCVCLRVS